MQPTVYPSVDAAVEDLMKMLPLVREIKTVMERTGKSRTDPAEYKRICSVIDMLSDREAFRARLEKLKGPGESVQFSFTQEAFNLLRKHEEEQSL